ncbi:MAG: molecular chaperone DnaJ [Paracoccus sp.]|nr:MAG: molecular chaperone DnaJ [Paracoccus sp. (in: a-proteobacteria)]
MSKRDYYEILGISRSATSSEIKKAYLKFAKKYHPDQNSDDPSAEQKFKELSEAYEILKTPQKKAAYDRFGHAAFEQGGPGQNDFNRRSHGQQHANMHNSFNDFFSDFMGGQQRSAQSRGADLKYDLSITLEEAFSGASKKIDFTTDVSCSPCSGRGTKDSGGVNNCPQCGGSGVVRMQQGFFAVEQVCGKCSGAGQVIKNPCSTCHGAGRHSKRKQLIVNVPAGVETSTRIRIAGEGEAGLRGGPGGDLYAFIHVKPHDIYQVEGSDLHCKLPLSFTKAALGAEVEVPTIEGSTVMLKIPSGMETGDKLRLSGKGMPRIRSASRGDMYVHAYIKTPKKLSKKQKEMLQALDKEIGEIDANYKDDGFFSRMKDMWS